MFCKNDSKSYREVLPGISMKAVVYGEKTLMTEFFLKSGSALPIHTHIHEQTGYLISGKILRTIGEETFEVEPGDSWSIPGGIIVQYFTNWIRKSSIPITISNIKQKSILKSE